MAKKGGGIYNDSVELITKTGMTTTNNTNLLEDIRKLKEFKKDVKAILENDVCTAQSLDEPEDRARVQAELIKGLINKYSFTLKSKPLAVPTTEFTCPDCGYCEERTYAEIEQNGTPVCDECDIDMEA